MSEFKIDPARCFPEDKIHENGDYYGRCCLCEQPFIGHKRRRICKLCTVEDQATTDVGPGIKLLPESTSLYELAEKQIELLKQLRAWDMFTGRGAVADAGYWCGLINEAIDEFGQYRRRHKGV